MAEKNLRVYKGDKTFFSKVTGTLKKILRPNNVGINNFTISIKRNNLLKAYNQYEIAKSDKLENEKDLKQKFETMYSLYLEAIDKLIVEHMYKKVKNQTAEDFEKNALAKYYTIAQIEADDFIEYKYTKQKFLLDLDNETLLMMNKPKLHDNFRDFYIYKTEDLYKKLLKNYSIRLADLKNRKARDAVYEGIYKILEDYCVNILTYKISEDTTGKYDNVKEDVEKLEKFSVGKLDKKDIIEKRMILLSISREIFTHSLPLAVCEKCYIRLIKETRSLIINTMNALKRDKIYKFLLELIEEFNKKLLSGKIYWDNPEQRAEYKEFWDKYNKVIKIKDEDERYKQLQILLVKADLNKLFTKVSGNRMMIVFYKCKLEALGAMRKLKNKCKSFSKLTRKAKVNE